MEMSIVPRADEARKNSILPTPSERLRDSALLLVMAAAREVELPPADLLFIAQQIREAAREVERRT